MNFFEHQRWAHRQTRILIFYFFLAVVALVGSATLGALAIVLWLNAGDVAPERLWEVGWGVALTTAVLIALASWGRWMMLRKGGASVAEMMGGQLIVHGDQDPQRKTLLNVVEEMAIASGIVMPQVYLLPRESSINAFAAGYSPNQAAVAFSQGCLDHLTRDELQGVVAHEFSHILHGDMRLNTYLVSLLFGIFSLTIAGRFFLRSLHWIRFSGRRGGRGQQGVFFVILAMMAFGLLLIVLGYFGVLFGQLIKSSISRQREFLADAAALQFTRNPLSIGGALKKIRDLSRYSWWKGQIEDYHAQELSHMFFASPGKFALDSLFASHPPLEERIRRIDRGLLRLPPYDPRTESPKKDQEQPKKPSRQGPPPIIPGLTRGQITPEQLLLTIGVLEGEQLSKAQRLLESLPESVIEACRDPLGAMAYTYALALEEDLVSRQAQIQWLKENESPHLRALIEPARQQIDRIDRSQRLRLIDLCLPTLKELAPQRKRSLLHHIQRIMYLNQQLDHFEFVLYSLLRHHLQDSSHLVAPLLPSRGLSQMSQEISLVLSALAHLSSASDSERIQAFNAGAEVLKEKSNLRYRTLTKAQGENLIWAIDRLRQLKPHKKEWVAKALIATALHLQPVLPQEQEMLRALLESMDTPAPFLDSAS